MPKGTKEEVAEYYRKYREKNGEKLRAYQAAYRKANAERLNAYLAEYRKKNRERIKEKYDKRKNARPWANLVKGAKQRARKKGIEFSLTEEWASKNFTGRCSVTGIEFSSCSDKGPTMRSGSIDRIDSSKGYTDDNCRFVINAFNSLKGEGSDTDALAIAEAVVRGLTVEVGK